MQRRHRLRRAQLRAPGTRPSLVQQVGAYSHVDRIIPTGTSPTLPAHIFGAEPPHDWCYYYQKASLARQLGDWAQVVGDGFGNEFLIQQARPVVNDHRLLGGQAGLRFLDLSRLGSEIIRYQFSHSRVGHSRVSHSRVSLARASSIEFAPAL